MGKNQPAGIPTVMPRIITHDVAGLTGFLKTVFDAQGELQAGAPTQIRIGDSLILISDGDRQREPMPAFLHVYVENADATWQRAVDAGARTLEAPADMPYGDRRAMVLDAWANIWQIATWRGN